jgi:hypothetical protein
MNLIKYELLLRQQRGKTLIRECNLERWIYELEYSGKLSGSCLFRQGSVKGFFPPLPIYEAIIPIACHMFCNCHIEMFLMLTSGEVV